MTTPEPEDDADAGVGAAPHLFLLLFIALVGAFGAWAYLGRLDIVSTAAGEVVPASQIKRVQHLEGGIVREILIREGDRVALDQPLVVLEPTQSDANVGELRSRIASLRIEVARLEAEAQGADRIVFPADVAASAPGLVAEAAELLRARKERQQSQIASLDEAMAQRQQEIRELTGRVRSQKDTLKVLDEKIAIGEELMKLDLTNRYRHLDVLKEASVLQGRIEDDTAALPRVEAALKEARAKRDGVRSSFREDARKGLEEARRNLDEALQRLRRLDDSLQRTVLRSPVEGVVKTVHTATRGGVVAPGGSVVDIVPGEDRLVVEARLPTGDIGYVAAGQPASIKLASTDAMRFGPLEGRVVQVSPDTLLTPQGLPFYKVRIETAADHFERGRLRYRLFPGMQVVASIRTGQRSVIEYLLDPFLYSFDFAMRER